MNSKTINTIASVIACIFAIVFLAIVIIACAIIYSCFNNNADIRNFFTVSILVMSIFMLPTAGIYYSTRYFLRRKIFWSMVPKGVPVIRKSKKIEYRVVHTHL